MFLLFFIVLSSVVFSNDSVPLTSSSSSSSTQLPSTQLPSTQRYTADTADTADNTNNTNDIARKVIMCSIVATVLVLIILAMKANYSIKFLPKKFENNVIKNNF